MAAMRESEMTRVVEALQPLVGAPFAGAWQPTRDRLILGLGRDNYLLLLPRGPLARLHTLFRRPSNPKRPFSFQGACRAHLSGRMTALTKTPDDRVVELVFGAHRLHLRLTGRGGGLWLLGEDRVIAAYDGPAPKSLPEFPAPTRRTLPVRFEPEGEETWDEAARRWFSDEERHLLQEQRRQVVSRQLRRRLTRQLRLAEGLDSDLCNAEASPGLRRQADALAANLHLLRRGMAMAVVDDLEDPTHQWQIPLDPSIPPAATMNRMYRRVRSLERVGERILEKIVELESHIGELREALVAVQTAQGEDLEGLARLAPNRHGPASTASQRDPWVTWVGPHGERVLVGRDSKANRRLTFQHARGRDFWLHLRGRPGAHVVIPIAGDQTPPLELLLAAAQIALVHAGLRDGAKADVQYTRVKHVRSIPGEAGGRVILHDEKVLHVDRDPAALVGWRRESFSEAGPGSA